jgi:hypothetical protein
MYYSNYSSENIENAYPIIKETIPATSLGYKTNNKYPEFPPLMSDGRSVTATWQPEATINEDLLQRNKIKSNWEYRKFLTDNAKQIMEYNFRESSNDIGYYKRPIDIPNIQSNIVGDIKNTPYRFVSTNDTSRPNGYESSDLKSLYLSREELETRKSATTLTQEQLLK